MRSTASLLMVLLLPCCGWNGSGRASSANAQASALFDPPTVTLMKDKVYLFEEGTIAGRGQKFHSDFAFRQAVIVGQP